MAAAVQTHTRTEAYVSRMEFDLVVESERLTNRHVALERLSATTEDFSETALAFIKDERLRCEVQGEGKNVDLEWLYRNHLDYVSAFICYLGQSRDRTQEARTTLAKAREKLDAGCPVTRAEQQALAQTSRAKAHKRKRGHVEVEVPQSELKQPMPSVWTNSDSDGTSSFLGRPAPHVAEATRNVQPRYLSCWACKRRRA